MWLVVYFILFPFLFHAMDGNATLIMQKCVGPLLPPSPRAKKGVQSVQMQGLSIQRAYKAYKFDVFEPVGHFLRICTPLYTFVRQNLEFVRFVRFVRLLGPPRAWVAPAAPLVKFWGSVRKRGTLLHTLATPI